MAGILDAYQFDPSSYGGNAQPGWLDLLFGNGAPPANAQAPQFQIAPTFPSVNLPTMGASAGYGAGADPTAQAAALPPTSAPTHGSGLAGLVSGLFGPSQANAQQAPQAAPQEPGMGDRAMAALANFSNSHGLLPALTGAITGGLTGQRTDPMGMMLQQQQALYKAFVPALLAKGASPEQAAALAQAAMLDPEVRKTISSTLYQPPQLIDAGTNPLTGEKYHQIYNPNNQTASNLTTTAQGGGASQTLTPANAAAVGLPSMSNNELSSIQQLNQSGLTGDEYGAKLKAISPAFATKVQSIANGDLPYPSGFIMKTPYGAMLTDAISALKPGVTAQDYALKQKNRAYWAAGGAGAQEIKAINTAITHATKLYDISGEMGGTDYAPGQLNPLIQGAKVAMGDQKFQQAQREWDATAETLATEVSKALNGGTPHVADKEHWREIFSNASGPTQRIAAIKAAMGILQGRTVSQAQNYTQGMQSLKEPLDFIDPGNREAFERLQAGLPPSGKGSADNQQSIQAGRPPSNPAEALSQAKDAISRGAPRDAVIERLKKNGINPAGL